MAEKPVFHQFNMVVSDMAATVAFYRCLGLTIPETDPDWTSHHRNAEMAGSIDLDFDSAQFARVWNEGWPDKPRMGVLGFSVSSRDAVNDIYRDLTEAGYTGEQQPYDTFWGARYAVVRDPDGNSVGIMSPVDPALRRPATPP